MKIAISCHPQAGGSGTVASELAMALARRGHEVHVVACQRPPRLRRDAGVRFHSFEVSRYPVFRFPPHDLCLITKLGEVVSRYGIEVVHAHYAMPHALAALVARGMAAPSTAAVVTTLHGTDVTLVGSHPSFFGLTAYTMEHCDGLTVVSQWLCERTREVFGAQFAPVVIPNFVDTSCFHPEGRVPFPEAGEFRLIHASNFRPVKRVTDVVRVFDLIRRKLPAHLTLVGDGPELDAVRELTAELNLCKQVTFMGMVRDVAPLLRDSHLFLLLSDYESFGVSALEAMACGVPVVVSNAGGLPEVVDSGRTGRLCDVGDFRCAADNARAILGDRALWERMSRHAAADARARFSTERIVPRYEALYTDILARTLRHG